MAATINSTSEFIPVDSRNAPGTIVLPVVNAIPGRLLTLKDMYGTFGTNPVTLSTQVGDSFEDGETVKVLGVPFGFLTLVSNGVSQWNILDGTFFPMYTISSLQTSLQVIQVSTFTDTLSSGTRLQRLDLLDQPTNEVYPIFSQSTFLYYGNSIVAGSKTGSGQFVSVI